jgi:hypothetical protein
MKLFKMFETIGFLGDWTNRALSPKFDANDAVIEDAGVVTAQEITDLGVGICKIWGIKTEFDLADQKQPG